MTALCALLHIQYCASHVRHARQVIAASQNASYNLVENRWIASTCAVQMHETLAHMHTTLTHTEHTLNVRLGAAAVRVHHTRFGYFCENADLSKTSLGRLFYLVRVCIVHSLQSARWRRPSTEQRHRSAFHKDDDSAFFVGSFSEHFSFVFFVVAFVEFGRTMTLVGPSWIPKIGIFIVFSSFWRQWNEPVRI